MSLVSHDVYQLIILAILDFALAMETMILHITTLIKGTIMRLVLITIMSCAFYLQAVGQDNKWYSSSGGEAILSWASVNSDGREGNVVTRFSGFFHFQSLVNKDFSQKSGFYTGLTMRNIGFIYDDPNNTSVRKKFRTYNLGIPVGIKVGNMEEKFMFFGYELEIPFNYKEKTFINEKKEDKFDVWFSDRTPSIMHTAFVGFRGPSGVSLKFKYYLTPMFNQDFTETTDTGSIQPYRGLEANVFYVALSFELFRNTDFTYDKPDESMAFHRRK